MHKEFRRKPNRKSIIRSDDTRHTHERVGVSRERRSTNIKREFADHRDKATGRGRVVGATANTWLVADDHRVEFEGPLFTNTIECHIGGLAITNNDDDSLVCVGDYVRYAEGQRSDGKAVILEIEKRSSRLLRQTAGERKLIQCLSSNIDQCVIVNSAAEPFYNRRLIDRYLIAAEQGAMSAAIVINKCELMPESVVRDDLACYSRMNIPVVLCSCVSREGLDEVRRLFRDKTSVLVGSSGVGKSSIINACFGIDLQAVREISTKYDKGKHTTTNSTIFALSETEFIVDTPGIREFAITDVHIDDLSYYFHDFDTYYNDCRFHPCTHTHEPDCAVKNAVESGEIDELRYDSYLRIRESLEQV